MLKRIMFFAAGDDLVPVLARLDARAPLRYFPRAAFEKDGQPSFDDSTGIPDMGIASADQAIACREFVIAKRDAEMVLSPIGWKKFSIIPGYNDDTLELRPGGVWQTGTTISGEVATLYNTPFPQALMRRFKSALPKEGFVKIRHWWVGPEALRRLAGGLRLTMAEQSPPEFDLTLPEDWAG